MGYNKLFSFVLISLTVSSCTDFDSRIQEIQHGTKAIASCPAAKVNVLKVSYNEAEKQYFIFHTAPASGEKLANPLKVENLQMAQIPPAKDAVGDSALLSFQKTGKSCNPVLEMTQGFKIELLAGNSGASSQGNKEGGSGSYWTPFLMGALTGHALSSMGSQPRYYAPPARHEPPHLGDRNPAMNTVPGQNSEPRKKGFFSGNRSASSRGGFFSRRKR